MSKQIKFNKDGGSLDGFIGIECFDFNINEDRFCITLGDDSNSCDEGAYRCAFLNLQQAQDLINFLQENL